MKSIDFNQFLETSCSISEHIGDNTELTSVFEESAGQYYQKVAKKRFCIAMMGVARTGKTSVIAALTKCPELFLQLTNEYGKKTEVIVETHFVEGTGGIIAYITWDDGTLKYTTAQPNDRIRKYNQLLKCQFGYILRDLGFKELEETAEPAALNAHVDEVIKSLNGYSTEPELIKELINTKGIDRFVKRIVLQVAPSDEFAKVLREKNIDLYIRETKGLSCIEMEDDKSQNTLPSLSKAGFDSLDAIVLIATDSMPAFISDSYKYFFKTILRSVPVFILARDKAMIHLFKNKSWHNTKEGADVYLAELQENTSLGHKDFSDIFYSDAYEFLKAAQIESPNLDWQFYDMITDYTGIEYLFPYVKQDAFSENFKIYQTVCTQIFLNIIEKIEYSHVSINKARKNAAKAFIYAYKNMRNTGNLNFVVKDTLPLFKCENLADNITNPAYSIYNEHGGITTKNNGKFKYAVTLAIAVASYKIIDSIVSDIDACVSSDIANDLLISKVLLNSLYKFADSDACVFDQFFTDRKVVTKGIKCVREITNLTGEDAVEYVIDCIIREFLTIVCNSI